MSKETKGELPSDYQKFIHLSRYARWNEEIGRRESWDETVSRYTSFMFNHVKEKYDYDVPAELRNEIYQAILTQKVMPSMRALMTAGTALERENVAGYNCSFVPVDNPRSFDEILYILMNGTGVGFSVESKYVSKLPAVADEFHPSETTIIVPDSKLGWAKSLKELIALLYQGLVPKWDMSKVRPAGSRLKVFGGRASGPEPLDDLFKFAVTTFQKASGRKLRSIECHDIVCKIAEIVVVGGVRRSALISLSDLSDEQMRHAKSGNWWETQGQRALANNSVSYENKPDIGTFMREWLALYDSKSGERGIYNAQAAKKQAEKLNELYSVERRKPIDNFGTNPCSEIILRPRQFCNLTEVVIRAEDDVESLQEKVRLATILGTFQSTLTKFNYLSKEWKKNCEEERLLGVSLTGIMDNAYTSGKKVYNDNGVKRELSEILQSLREVAYNTNLEFADNLKINPSASITCVKPSGTVSQLVDSASGIHSRHNPYYIRTVRVDKKDPICQFMQEKGFPAEPDVMKPDNTMVFSFPMKSPKKAICRDDMSALEQLELWLSYQRHWCEHKPSVTISVKEHEWLEVGSWVYEHFDEVSGISFLPFSDHVYRQAPYQDCEEADYKEELAKMPEEVDWSELANFEQEDNTAGSQQMACSAGACEIVDLVK